MIIFLHTLSVVLLVSWHLPFYISSPFLSPPRPLSYTLLLFPHLSAPPVLSSSPRLLFLSSSTTLFSDWLFFYIIVCARAKFSLPRVLLPLLLLLVIQPSLDGSVADLRLVCVVCCILSLWGVCVSRSPVSHCFSDIIFPVVILLFLIPLFRLSLDYDTSTSLRFPLLSSVSAVVV